MWPALVSEGARILALLVKRVLVQDARHRTKTYLDKIIPYLLVFNPNTSPSLERICESGFTAHQRYNIVCLSELYIISRIYD